MNRDREPFENTVLLALRELGVSFVFVVLVFRIDSHVSHCLVDRVGGTTKWMQHGTVLAYWQNTQTDYAGASFASSWPAVNGPDIPPKKMRAKWRDQPHVMRRAERVGFRSYPFFLGL